MKKSTILFIILIAGMSLITKAKKQGQERIDSLLTQLPKAREDTNKVNFLTDLSYTYYIINRDEGLKYGKQGLALVEKLNWKKGIAYSNLRIGINYYVKKEFPVALEYDLKALKQFEEIDDKTGKAKVL